VLLAPVQPPCFVPQIRQSATGQSLVLRPQRALNLLAAHGKPRKVDSAIIDIENLGDAIQPV